MKVKSRRKLFKSLANLNISLDLVILKCYLSIALVFSFAHFVLILYLKNRFHKKNAIHIFLTFLLIIFCSLYNSSKNLEYNHVLFHNKFRDFRQFYIQIEANVY